MILPVMFVLRFYFQGSHLKVVLIDIDETWMHWTKNSTSTKSSWEEEFHMVGPFNKKKIPLNLEGYYNVTYTTSYVWTLTIEWYKILIFNPNYQPHDLKKYKDEFNHKGYYNVTYTTSWVWSLTIKWYKIFISNPNYQSNMTWKSIKMNLIIKGITTWPIL